MTNSVPKHTIQDIKNIITTYKECIKNGAIIICEERDKNQNFLFNYPLSKKERQQLLLSLKTDELSEIRYDDKNKSNLIYIFELKRHLIDLNGKSKNIIIYLKFKLHIRQNSTKYAVVLSLHKAEYKMKRYFKI